MDGSRGVLHSLLGVVCHVSVKCFAGFQEALFTGRLTATLISVSFISSPANSTTLLFRRSRPYSIPSLNKNNQPTRLKQKRSGSGEIRSLTNEPGTENKLRYLKFLLILQCADPWASMRLEKRLDHLKMEKARKAGWNLSRSGAWALPPPCRAKRFGFAGYILTKECSARPGTRPLDVWK